MWLEKQKNTDRLVFKFSKEIKVKDALQDAKSTAYQKKNLDKASIMHWKKNTQGTHFHLRGCKPHLLIKFSGEKKFPHK